MLARIFLLSLVLISGCSTAQHNQDIQNDLSRTWKGKPTSELDKLAYLQALKRTDTDDYVMFSKEGNFPTQARCASLGGCMGTGIIGCDHLFKIKDKIIESYSARGDCYVESEWLLKKSRGP